MIRLSKSCIGDAEKEAVLGVLDREFLGMGSEVNQFEQSLTEFFGRPAVCVVNGTAALHLALQAAGIGIGDQVLVQSLTYVASFQAIFATGAKPIACDVDPETLCLDWKDAEKRITPKTKAVMPVHYAGGVGALDEIYAFAQRHHLIVIEDAAHAFGSMYQGKKVGGFGDIACFSFDGIKNITSGEGGCVVTSDEDVLSKIRDARLLGVEKDTEKRYSGQRSRAFDVSEQGWRYHMSNIMASIGMAQFDKKENLFARRRNAAKYYDERFENRSDIIIIDNNYNEIVPHIYVVRLPMLKDRDGLMMCMLDHGIETGTHYLPNHLLQFYKKDNESPELNVAEAVWPTLLTLPLHPEISKEKVNYISDTLINNLIDFS